MHLKSESESNNTDHHNNGNAIVRVESAAGLDELFKAIMSPNDGQSRLPHQVPMRQRRLPPSFFRPPSASSSNNSLASASHSRESSLDGGYQSGQTPVNTPNNGQAKQNNVTVLNYSGANNGMIIHPRANSSPAALQPANESVNNLSSSGGQSFNSNEVLAKPSNESATINSAPLTTHFRQMSYDLNQIRLPDGWEMSFTASGERYFLNHKEKTTTWEDPRKKIVEEMLHHNNSSSKQLPSINSLHPQNVGSLSSASNMQPQQQQQQSSAIQTSVQNGLSQQQNSSGSITSTPLPASNSTHVVHEHLSYIDPTLVPLPNGWEQAQTNTGDIYFISHIDQTTTWFHPSIPRNLQMKRIQQQTCSIQPPPFQTNGAKNASTINNNAMNIPPELVVALKNMNTSCQQQQTSASITASSIMPPVASMVTNPLEMSMQKTPQNQHLRDLELERERMKQRQEELLQSSLLNSSASNNLLSVSNDQATSSPFMLQNECHSRQDSIDSGLDLGNSSGFSSTPLLTIDSNMFRLTNNPTSSTTTTPAQTNFLPTVISNQTVSSNTANTNNAPLSDEMMAFENMQISGLDLDSESMDFMQGLDIDLLSNVEELLNSNKDNIMTWL
ncbi:Transcriptional coactivator YAP1 [Sarcoptes scabiei]|uniref:Transcriptional coactivator YAP1 n=1 Tax=Sarcoptes scabiei TaxID=52283 RepID=A0A132A5J4_SARSC|nr:Transcriptional coactivator YAP1 [Sarcoptes scabiei]KPM06232.1 Yorkie-like protein [Sarcoptes scabiei]UXI18336.1 XRP2-like protein [Sarcoptes scabiei]